MNLCIALLLSYIVFLAGVDRTESAVCITRLPANVFIGLGTEFITQRSFLIKRWSLWEHKKNPENYFVVRLVFTPKKKNVFLHMVRDIITCFKTETSVEYNIYFVCEEAVTRTPRRILLVFISGILCGCGSISTLYIPRGIQSYASRRNRACVYGFGCICHKVKDS